MFTPSQSYSGEKRDERAAVGDGKGAEQAAHIADRKAVLSPVYDGKSGKFGKLCEHGYVAVPQTARVKTVSAVCNTVAQKKNRIHRYTSVSRFFFYNNIYSAAGQQIFAEGLTHPHTLWYYTYV